MDLIKVRTILFSACMFSDCMQCLLACKCIQPAQSCTLVDSDGSAHDDAVHDVSTDVTSKESATSSDLKEHEEKSGKHLKLHT